MYSTQSMKCVFKKKKKRHSYRPDQSTSDRDNLYGENTFLSDMQQFSKGRKPF